MPPIYRFRKKPWMLAISLTIRYINMKSWEISIWHFRQRVISSISSIFWVLPTVFLQELWECWSWESMGLWFGWTAVTWRLSWLGCCPCFLTFTHWYSMTVRTRWRLQTTFDKTSIAPFPRPSETFNFMGSGTRIVGLPTQNTRLLYRLFSAP